MTFRFPEKPHKHRGFTPSRPYVPEPPKKKRNVTPKTKAYHLPTRRGKKELPAIERPGRVSLREPETLTGIVQNKKASDLEERFARALSQARLPFKFQYLMDTQYTRPGQPKNIDFVVKDAGRIYPIEVYGQYFHTSAGDRRHDQKRERELDDKFQALGWERLQIVWWYELFDQPAANLVIRKLFI